MGRKTLRHYNKHQVISLGTVGCDVWNHPAQEKLLFNTENIIQNIQYYI